MFQIALVLDHLWNQISKCCWIFPLFASTLCPVWKSLLPVVNYTINDTEEINSIWPLPPGVTRLMSRLSDPSPDKCDIRRLRRSQVQSRGRQETLDICADLSQHRTYPQSDSPGHLSGPVSWWSLLWQHNSPPLHLSWLLAWQGSQEQVQWSSCSLVFKPHSRNPTENKQNINVLTSLQWASGWSTLEP